MSVSSIIKGAFIHTRVKKKNEEDFKGPLGQQPGYAIVLGVLKTEKRKKKC